MGGAAGALLEVRDLHVSFDTEAGAVPAVRGVDLRVQRGETLAVVGESGCGKSVTALAILRLLDPSGRIERGAVRFDGQDLLGLSEPEMRALRGRRIGMVFQEPMTSLNPVFTVGDQIGEVLAIHRGLGKRERRAEAIRLLEKVGIPAAAERVDQYPHEMSGGMKQRVMIAIAIACEPEVLIADEPTTALDVTVQAQILDLLRALQQEMRMAIVLITHNLGVVAQFAQRVLVMYAGKIVERSDVATLFREPLHPYTRALLRALPSRSAHAERLVSIAGTVPSPLEYPPGCAFCARCPDVLPRCADDEPRLEGVEAGHAVACWLHAGTGAR
ncbi:MAG: ABC transporter ATP-binding protein [Deltaproteobacteria bacterium]|nr:MAG: ABC transporter ATP-binding protein [Deltaproteobacteria bacterium]